MGDLQKGSVDVECREMEQRLVNTAKACQNALTIRLALCRDAVARLRDSASGEGIKLTPEEEAAARLSIQKAQAMLDDVYHLILEG